MQIYLTKKTNNKKKTQKKQSHKNIKKRFIFKFHYPEHKKHSLKEIIAIFYTFRI